MADDRTTQRWWGVDLLATLISHRRRSLAFPITTLAAPVKLSSSFALLVPAVGGAPLPPPDSLTARWAAVPLTTVAIRTNGEHGPTLRGATGSHSENRHHLARYPAPQFFVQSGLAQIRMVGERQRFQPHMTAFQCHRLYTHPFILQTVHICEARQPKPYTVNRSIMHKIAVLFLILANGTWAAGALKVMKAFGTGNLREGSDLYAGLILDSQGKLYGVAESGGTRGAGVVYELSPITGGGWTETVLYNFKGGTEDGASPHATLIADSAGNLYGTTVSGGLTGKTCRTGCGTVFKLTPASGHWQESVLHRFTGGAGGAVPYAGVVMDSAGNLYGATLDGGAAGGGAVYRLTPGSAGWEQSVLYSFQGRPDGSAPYPTPVLDAAGNLYGTTNAGGAHNLGIVYMLAPQSDG